MYLPLLPLYSRLIVPLSRATSSFFSHTEKRQRHKFSRESVNLTHPLQVDLRTRRGLLFHLMQLFARANMSSNNPFTSYNSHPLNPSFLYGELARRLSSTFVENASKYGGCAINFTTSTRVIQIEGGYRRDHGHIDD